MSVFKWVETVFKQTESQDVEQEEAAEEAEDVSTKPKGHTYCNKIFKLIEIMTGENLGLIRA